MVKDWSGRGWRTREIQVVDGEREVDVYTLVAGSLDSLLVSAA